MADHSGPPHGASTSQDDQENEDVYLDEAEADEEIELDEDHPMEEDEGDEILLENNSSAHFDKHTDSIFCIAQHPIHPHVIITGSGDDTAYIFDSTPNSEKPLLPASYETTPQPKQERESLPVLAHLDGHSDSVNAVCFTQPKGQYVVTAGLDGKLRAWEDTSSGLEGKAWRFLAEAQEVEEINWVIACPVSQLNGGEENVIALGALDGSVWVYRIDGSADAPEPLSIVNTYFQHTGPCTAGAWSPDGNLLATVSEEGSFYVFDVFGAAAAAGVDVSAGAQAVIGLTAEDQRFAVEGGLYSVAIAPSGAFAAVGGAEGIIKVVGLPRLSETSSSKASKSKPKAGAAAQSVGGGAGTILASLQAQSDGIETLSFSSLPLTLLAAGSVDGSIALFDTAHRFAVRRHIRGAHEESAVVKVDFVRDYSTSQHQSAGTSSGRPWLLTSVGMDGVVRRWDTRGGTAAANYGMIKEWRGHVGVAENDEGEQSGGILGFVQGDQEGRRIVTAGDDGLALVFEE
ncbi:hypothetical protein FQN57_006560 [Myotisia sp. PD_48]|nr:hypothetical protein FQN57_006560 [Myotisia sp. PD_48]